MFGDKLKKLASSHSDAQSNFSDRQKKYVKSTAQAVQRTLKWEKRRSTGRNPYRRTANEVSRAVVLATRKRDRAKADVADMIGTRSKNVKVYISNTVSEACNVATK